MTRRPRILFVLPAIVDELDAATKNRLALRNACSVEGVCPGCGAVGELTADVEMRGVYHLTFRHEHDCEAAA